MFVVLCLFVNVNVIVMLCNCWDLLWFSVIGLVVIVMEVGVKGIIVYLWFDECYICKFDVFELVELIEDWFLNKEFCLEGYLILDFMVLVESVWFE